VALIMRKLVTSVAGLISSCGAFNCPRLMNDGDEVIVRVGDVPALISLGEMLIDSALAPPQNSEARMTTIGAITDRGFIGVLICIPSHSVET
jgi:hypothetical protein